MVKVYPYLNFDGNCKEAFEFYHRVLGGTLDVQTFGDSPMADEAGAAMKDRVLHARLALSDTLLMASDSQPNQHTPPQGVHVSIIVDSPTDADRIFNALAEGGSISMPIQETFWADRFGMCVDKFGTPWMVNCAKVLSGALS